MSLVREEWRPVPTYRVNRKCKHKGCKQILSIYNPNQFCFVHATKNRIRQMEKTAKAGSGGKWGMMAK